MLQYCYGACKIIITFLLGINYITIYKNRNIYLNIVSAHINILHCIVYMLNKKVFRTQTSLLKAGINDSLRNYFIKTTFV